MQALPATATMVDEDAETVGLPDVRGIIRMQAKDACARCADEHEPSLDQTGYSHGVDQGPDGFLYPPEPCRADHLWRALAAIEATADIAERPIPLF